MVESARRYYQQLSEALAVAAVVILTVGFGLSGKAPAPAGSSELKVLDAATRQSGLKVDGYGDEAPTGVGGSLQGAAPVDQSGKVGEDLQNPAGSDKIQPNSGRSSLE
jgi:hypothetical protein